MRTVTRQWKPYMMALAFVCFGAALGVFMDRLYLYYQTKKLQQASTSSRQEAPTLEGLVHFFSKQLQLSPKQVQQFKIHLRKGLSFFRNRPPEVNRFLQKGRKIREQFQDAIRGILNAKQKRIFNNMVRQANMRRFELHFQRARFQKQILDSSK